jgi:hypothetical protein
MNNARIVYVQHEGITPQAELSAVAACYRIILESAKQRGRLPDKSGPYDGTKVKEDSANEYRST